jgi:hypothetical protein
VLEANLTGSENVARRMKAHFHGPDMKRSAELVAIDRDLLPESRTHEGYAGAGRIVTGCAAPGVVAVRVGNHRALHRATRIHVEIARLAVKALFTKGKHVGTHSSTAAERKTSDCYTA